MRTRLRPEERRARLLESAVAVFAERGYSASISELAAAAGLTRTVVYHYFADKQELYLAVLNRESARLLEHLAPVIGGPGTTEERARATSTTLLEYVAAHPLSWRVLFHPRDDGHPEVAAAHRRAHEATMTVAATLFAADMADANLDATGPRVALFAEMQLAAVVAVARWWREHPDVDLQVVADAAVDLLWHGLSGLPERAR